MSDPILSPFAEAIFRRTYAYTPGEIWPECAHRVAKAVAADASQEASFEQLIRDRVFIPGGRYLYSAGRPIFQNANCFGFSVGDSREEWARVLRDAIMCLSMGGGIGVEYSNLRPKDAPIGRMGGKSSGPLALMGMVNEVGRHVFSGGTRRSAIWAGLSWRHPDVRDFITVKDWDEDTRALKAKRFEAPAPLDMTNVSVVIDNGYLDGLRDGDPAALRLHALVWEHMARTGEPAFRNQALIEEDDRGAITGNPCQEAVLHDRDSCNLGSIVLPRIKNLAHLEAVTRLAVQFLYNGSLRADYPTSEIAAVAARNRRIGLGIMGLHEFMLREGHRYEWFDELGRWLNVWRGAAADEARRYARKCGGPTPITTRAIAPTGTISIIAETTSGIEPVFCLAPGTRVLTYGLDWVGVETLQPGDEVVGFREKPLNLWSNRFGRSIVLSRSICRRPSYRIETDRGTVVASSEHLWVVRRPLPPSGQTHLGQGYQWVRTDALVPGMQIAFTIKPWDRDITFEGGWLSGMFDGEGYARPGSRRRGLLVSISQNEGPVLTRLRTLLQQRGIDCAERIVKSPHPCVTLAPRGTWTALKTLGMFRPIRLMSKMTDAFEYVKLFGSRYSAPAIINGIEFIGETDVVAVETSTQTFIADGFLSHNCSAYKRRYLVGGKHYYRYVVDPTAARFLTNGGGSLVEDAYALAADFERRLEVQAKVQEYVDQAISSTVNLPAWGEPGNDDPAGMAATVARYLPRLKGLTCYPNGSRPGQPITPVDPEMALREADVVFEEEGECRTGVCGL